MKLAYAMTLAAALFAAPVLAESIAVGTQVGHDDAQIRATLTGQGYEVRKTDTEDGKIEVYAVKEGKKLEIYVDPTTGAVTKVKEKG